MESDGRCKSIIRALFRACKSGRKDAQVATTAICRDSDVEEAEKLVRAFAEELIEVVPRIDVHQYKTNEAANCSIVARIVQQ